MRGTSLHGACAMRQRKGEHGAKLRYAAMAYVLPESHTKMDDTTHMRVGGSRSQHQRDATTLASHAPAQRTSRRRKCPIATSEVNAVNVTLTVLQPIPAS